jgi:hypothetical protein
LHFDGEHFRDFMTEPTWCRVDGRLMYRYVMGGFLVKILVSKHPLPKKYERIQINPSEPPFSIDVDFKEIGFLTRVWQDMIKTTAHVNI